MVVQIEGVKKEYFALVAQLQLLDNQLAERQQRGDDAPLRARHERKAELAARIAEAYDTDRTSLLETFLSGGSFTDVISEVSYINDFAEQDKALAQQIVHDQEALATIHAIGRVDPRPDRHAPGRDRSSRSRSSTPSSSS